MKPVIDTDSESGVFYDSEKERGISIYFTDDIRPLTEEQEAAIMKELASILGNGEPLTQIEADHLSTIVPKESPKKVDNRFWARKQANKQLRKFK